MLSVAPIRNAAQAASYFERDDYYQRGAEGPAQWWGAGAAAAGLTGEVNRQELQAVLSGELPDGTKLGVQRDGAWQHRPGWDLTFSAPKSVSILAEVAGDMRLVEAHDRAVRAAMTTVEATLAHTRIRKEGDVELVGTGNLIVALFRHDMNRSAEPQLHTHALVVNATQDANGQWRSLESRPIFQSQKDIGILYRQHLAAEVVALGYAIVPGKDNTFEIKDVPRELIVAFSSRAADVEARLEKLGLDRETATPKQAESAAVRSREPKRDVDRDAQRTAWTATAERIAPEILQAPDQAKTERARNPLQPDVQHHDAVRFVRSAIATLSERNAAFTAESLEKTARVHAFGRATPDQIGGAIVTVTARGELVPRTVIAVDVNTRSDLQTTGFTTPEGIKTERQMLAHAEAARNAVGPMLSGREAQHVIAAAERAAVTRGHEWNQGQKDAAYGLLRGTDRVMMLQGLAGTAKTTTVLATLAGSATAQGYDVIGIAPTAVAASVLGEALAIEGKTVHRHLLDVEEASREKGTSKTWRAHPGAAGWHGGHNPSHDKPQIWIVDEAALMGAGKTRDLLAAAEQRNARVVLVGDVRQLASVEAGRAFGQLQEAGVQTFRMDEIVRQRTEAGRNTVYAALDRDASAALGWVEKNQGKVLEHKEDHERVDAIADLYAHQDRAERNRTVVVDPSREGRDAINQAVRERLQVTGELTGTEVHATRLAAAGLANAEKKLAISYHPGEVVRFARNYQRGERPIEKGEYLAVAAIDVLRNTVTLMSDKGESITWDPEKWGAKSAEVYRQHDAGLQLGDRIRWGRNDADRGLFNGTVATVEKVDAASAKLKFDNGKEAVLDLRARRDQHYNHAYAVTAYGAQGGTAERTIFHAEAWRLNLIHERSFYVALSRAQGESVVVTEDRADLISVIADRAGGKMAALDGQEAKREAEKTVNSVRQAYDFVKRQWDSLKDILGERAEIKAERARASGATKDPEPTAPDQNRPSKPEQAAGKEISRNRDIDINF